MTRLLVVLAVLCMALPVEAHRLKLFATVTDGAISGYGFFVGGGRAGDVDVIVRDAAGAEIARVKTDAVGAFSYRPAAPGAFTLTLDTGDGHATEVAIAPERFAEVAPPATAEPAPAADTPAPPSGAAFEPDALARAVAVEVGKSLAATVDRAAERAVARQIQPLLEAYAEAEARIRVNDILGGLSWIVGLVGIGAWVLSRRRPRGGTPE